jgi:hypothetical protein
MNALPVRIPPAGSVDPSYSAYKTSLEICFRIPPSEWWIVHNSALENQLDHYLSTSSIAIESGPSIIAAREFPLPNR